MRTFVALELSQEVRDGLDGLIRGLSGLTRDVRWVRPEGIHLTLKFLGEISAEGASRAAEALRRSAARHAPLSFSVEGTGWFPEKSRRPRVIWAGVTSGPELGLLQADADRELAREGFPREARPFTPHLTLGRAKNPAGAGKLLGELVKSAATVFGSVQAEEVVLFESVLRPGGAVYKALERIPLK
jgi:2'-5' RNA ligase